MMDAMSSKLNGFHSGYLLFGKVCENCENNMLRYVLRKHIKCLGSECPISLLNRNTEELIENADNGYTLCPSEALLHVKSDEN